MVGLLGALTFTAWCSHALAVINVMDHPSFNQYIAIQNNTGQAMTFVRTAMVCVSASPDSFTVGANSGTTITVTQKYSDTGLDNCYARNHNTTYQDSANSSNMFRIQQYASSNDYSCLDVKYNAIIWINNAVCPEATGKVFGPIGDTPSVSCSDGVPNCPPRDDATPAEYFGFVITNPPPFAVTINNHNQGQGLDCVFTDLNNKTDRNSCVISYPSVGAGVKSAVSLAGTCGNKAYRLSVRTNVQLVCYLSNTVYQGAKTWVPTTNGATYDYPSASLKNP
jgi:hypothetical protein